MASIGIQGQINDVIVVQFTC